MAISDKEWGKFTEKINRMHEDIKKIQKSVDKQNGRIDDIEIWRGKVIGIVLGLTFVIPTVVSLLIKYVL